MRTFRLSERIRYLWVDSICINQDDVRERNHQVKKMTEIYAVAVQVLVYLGEESQNTDTLFSLMRLLICDQNGVRCESEHVEHFTLYDLIHSKNSQDARWKEWLDQLLNRRWFGRVWVLQEIVMAQRAILFCGPHSIDWGYFTPSPFKGTTIKDDHLEAPFPPILRLGKGLITRAVDFVDLLFATRECVSTDPRDKIFALLDFYKSSAGAAPEADYSKSVEDVFVEATMYCIRSNSDANG